MPAVHSEAPILEGLKGLGYWILTDRTSNQQLKTVVFTSHQLTRPPAEALLWLQECCGLEALPSTIQSSWMGPSARIPIVSGSLGSAEVTPQHSASAPRC